MELLEAVGLSFDEHEGLFEVVLLLGSHVLLEGEGTFLF